MDVSLEKLFLKFLLKCALWAGVARGAGDDTTQHMTHCAEPSNATALAQLGWTISQRRVVIISLMTQFGERCFGSRAE